MVELPALPAALPDKVEAVIVTDDVEEAYTPPPEPPAPLPSEPPPLPAVLPATTEPVMASGPPSRAAPPPEPPMPPECVTARAVAGVVVREESSR